METAFQNSTKTFVERIYDERGGKAQPTDMDVGAKMTGRTMPRVAMTILGKAIKMYGGS